MPIKYTHRLTIHGCKSVEWWSRVASHYPRYRSGGSGDGWRRLSSSLRARIALTDPTGSWQASDTWST